MRLFHLFFLFPKKFLPFFPPLFIWTSSQEKSSSFLLFPSVKRLENRGKILTASQKSPELQRTGKFRLRSFSLALFTLAHLMLLKIVSYWGKKSYLQGRSWWQFFWGGRIANILFATVYRVMQIMWVWFNLGAEEIEYRCIKREKGKFATGKLYICTKMWQFLQWFHWHSNKNISVTRNFMTFRGNLKFTEIDLSPNSVRRINLYRLFLISFPNLFSLTNANNVGRDITGIPQKFLPWEEKARKNLCQSRHIFPGIPVSDISESEKKRRAGIFEKSSKRLLSDKREAKFCDPFLCSCQILLAFTWKEREKDWVNAEFFSLNMTPLIWGNFPKQKKVSLSLKREIQEVYRSWQRGTGWLLNIGTV